MNYTLPVSVPGAHIAVYLLFNFFILFIIVYSALAFFDLQRFGRSRMIGLLVTLVYVLVVGSLYLQVSALIARL